MTKSILIFATFLFAFLNVRAEHDIVDRRKVYIYFRSENLSEYQNKINNDKTDSFYIENVRIINKDSGNNFDTISCRYTRNSIYFNSIDTSINKIDKLYLLFDILYKKQNRKFNERISIPFNYLYNYSTTESKLFICLRRIKNNVYEVSEINIDFPLLEKKEFIASEILNFE